MILENDNRRVLNNFPYPYSGLGKLPPQATDLEEAVLGGLLLERDAMPIVADMLKPEMFYRDNHQKVYSALKFLFDKSNPIDILTVTARLRQQGELEMVGGAYYITELTDRVASAANIEYHARIIVQKFIQRELIRISTEVINSAYEDTTDVLDLIDKAEKAIFTLNANKGQKKGSYVSDLVEMRKKEYRVHVPDGLTGVPTGLHDLDKITHGWQKKDLIIVAARPSMGKTAFALMCACHPSLDFGLPVVFFSLEMSELQLTDRAISSESDVLLENLLTHNLTEADHENIEKNTEKLSMAPIIIDDTPNLSITEFRSKCRKLKADMDIQLIIIDYLQLMNGKSDNRTNREQEIGTITRALKGVAKELNVPVIALSQLSRAADTRPGNSKRPMLSDLRESGNIEQDADVVLFLYRDEYYGIYRDANGKSTVGKSEIIIAKNRNGKTDVAYADFNGAKMRFKDWNWQVKQQATLNYEPPKDDEEIELPF